MKRKGRLFRHGLGKGVVCSLHLTIWGAGYFLPTLFCAFLRTYMLVHCCKSNVKFELSFQNCLHEQSWVSNVALPSSPWVIHSSVQLTRLTCLLWPSIRLFLLSQVLPFTIHSLPLTHFLREQYGTDWDQFFFTTLFFIRWLIQQCLSAQGMWLPVTPFVNPL